MEGQPLQWVGVDLTSAGDAGARQCSDGQCHWEALYNWEGMDEV